MKTGAEGITFERIPDAPPAPGTEAAKLLLESLRPHPDSKRRHTTPLPRIPATNRLGIVIKPVPAPYDKEKLTTWQREHGVHQSNHHLYWPKSVFQKAGSLAKEFRELPHNIERYPNFQHVKFHSRYDPFIMKYPTYLIPPKDIMETAIDESRNLHLLGVHVTSLEAILDGLDDMTPQVTEEVHEKKEIITILCSRVITSEIIYPSHVQEAITRAQRYVPDQFQR